MKKVILTTVYLILTITIGYSQVEYNLTGEWIRTSDNMCNKLEKDGDNYKIMACSNNTSENSYIKIGQNKYRANWSNIIFIVTDENTIEFIEGVSEKWTRKNPTIREDTYYFISNEVMGDGKGLGYSIDMNNFQMTDDKSKYSLWRLVPIKFGHWEKSPGDARYTWVDNAKLNQYSIQLFINGKFWALSATSDANPVPILAKVSDADKYQKWEVDIQLRGFFKITNVGLKNDHNRFSTLYADPSLKDIFLHDWEQNKLISAFWGLISQHPVGPNDGKSWLDNKRLFLSTPWNKDMCLIHIRTSDIHTIPLISPCNNTTADRFIFEPTILGSYFIKVELNNGNSYYLDNQLELRYLNEFNVFKPDVKHTWSVYNVGIGLFMFINPEGMTFEMVKGYYNNSGGLPDRIELKKFEGWQTKPEQQHWYLHE